MKTKIDTKNFSMTSSFATALLVVLYAAALLLATVKGAVLPNQQLDYQAEAKTQPGSPFESTNSTSRYMTVVSLMTRGTFELNENEARSAAPDIVRVNGKFFSVFNPGVSLATMPFYWLGQHYGIPQLMSFGVNVIASLINVYLIFVISRKFKTTRSAAWLAGLIFLFATNAWAYTQTLTQHPLSTMVILLAVVNVMDTERNWINNLTFGILCGVGLLLDFPNLFLLTPVGIYALAKHILIQEKTADFQLKINLWFPMILVGLIPIVLFYGWFNATTISSPTKVAQFLGRSNYFDTNEKKMRDEESKKTVLVFDRDLPFDTRLQTQGSYVLLWSNERGWLFFSPVLLFGVLGAIVWYKKHPHSQTMIVVLTGIVVTNIVIYASFGDPWGGWSFGPRYLLPSAAIMSLFLGFGFSALKRNLLWLTLVLLPLIYSVSISTAGVLTSAAIPPKQEAQALQNYVPYTMKFNFDLIQNNQSSSLLFNSVLKQQINLKQFHQMLTGLVLVLMLALVAKNYVEDNS